MRWTSRRVGEGMSGAKTLKDYRRKVCAALDDDFLRASCASFLKKHYPGLAAREDDPDLTAAVKVLISARSSAIFSSFPPTTSFPGNHGLPQCLATDCPGRVLQPRGGARKKNPTSWSGTSRNYLRSGLNREIRTSYY